MLNTYCCCRCGGTTAEHITAIDGGCQCNKELHKSKDQQTGTKPNTILGRIVVSVVIAIITITVIITAITKSM